MRSAILGEHRLYRHGFYTFYIPQPFSTLKYGIHRSATHQIGTCLHPLFITSFSTYTFFGSSFSTSSTISTPFVPKSNIPTVAPWSTDDIRESFLRFFELNSYLRVPSSSLVPDVDDGSLLFTNAGMVQFKDILTGAKRAPVPRVTSVQKCLRVGGKHNDLDNVGRTARHHSFFEMLGNFSFANTMNIEACVDGTSRDAEKEKSLVLALTFLTDILQLDPTRLSVSVLEGDKHTAQLWKKITGWDDNRIFERPADENYWSMGDGPGPCGPCTEIFWDQRQIIDGERYLELWNIVFIQEEKLSDGSFRSIPLCIDTGMGLERVASVVQNVKTNFDIDSIQKLRSTFKSIPINDQTTPLSGPVNDSFDEGSRVIADHFRAICFLLTDGVIPSNVGRGYVLRRLIRRAILYGYMNCIRKPFLKHLYPTLAMVMKDAYPDLSTQTVQKVIYNILEREETNFFRTISIGLQKLDKFFQQSENQSSSGIIPGDLIFKLYDTHGLPSELTSLVGQKKGWTLDMKGFDIALAQQRANGKKSWKNSKSKIPPEVKDWVRTEERATFVGYDELVTSSHIIAKKDGKDDEVWLIIEPCPFYCEAGGQIGDIGQLILKNGEIFIVDDSLLAFEGGRVLRVRSSDPAQMMQLQSGVKMKAIVDKEHRMNCAMHHTATHLLHAALEKELRNELPIQQMGSLVLPDRLRFDFTYQKALSDDQILAVERNVNSIISNNQTVKTSILPQEEAMRRVQSATGVTVLGQKYAKYGPLVRVVSVGSSSIELCGGTHVSNTNDLFTFKIVTQSAIAAGIRRIEAKVGRYAVLWLKDNFEKFLQISSLLNAPLHQAEKEIIKLKKGLVKLKTENKQLKKEINKLQIESWSPQCLSFKSIPVRLYDTPYTIIKDRKLMKKQSDQLLEQTPDAFHIFSCEKNRKCIVQVHKNCQYHANQLMSHLLTVMGGKGGGRQFYAQGVIGKTSTKGMSFDISDALIQSA